MIHMNIKTLSVLLILLLTYSINALEKDLSIQIHQSSINKVLSHIEPIRKKEVINFNKKQLDIEWELSNPKIKINENEATYEINAVIDFKIIKDHITAIGNVDINYDKNRNKLLIQITDATFDLSSQLFNSKIPLKKIDFSNFFETKYEFNIPEIPTSNISLNINNKKKTLQISTSEPTIELLPEIIQLNYQTVITEKQ